MWASGEFHGLFLTKKYKMGDWLNVYKCNGLHLKHKSSPLQFLHTFPKHVFELSVTNVTQLSLNTPH